MVRVRKSRWRREVWWRRWWSGRVWGSCGLRVDMVVVLPVKCFWGGVLMKGDIYGRVDGVNVIQILC